MSQTLAILGRQPALGLAELESLYGAKRVSAVGQHAALLDLDPCVIDFNRLGGTIKLCKLLVERDTTNWRELERFLLGVSPDHATQMPEGKMHLGLSVYGIEAPVQELLATGLRLKKAIQKQTSRSVRLVPNKSVELNTAQVLHNKLTSPNGWELVFVKNGDKTVIGQTVLVQDIDRYSERDFGRPKRDTRVGMLPPKLAQLLINLATGSAEFGAIKDQLSVGVCLSVADEQKMHAERANLTVLDPFCGTGVVLQEALLMGYHACGSDIETRMIDYSRQNLEWLASRYAISADGATLSVGDATAMQWPGPVGLVASETYLGRPFTSTPTPEILAQTVTDCNLIIKKFLKNLHAQLQPGTRICLAIPAWITSQSGPRATRLDEVQGATEQRSKPYTKYGARAAQVATPQFAKSPRGVFGSAEKQSGAARYAWHLPLVDQIEDIGYNQVRFERARNADLLYYRSDQIVARELLVITRK